MSLDATRWAWLQRIGRSSAKLVLLSIADRAGEDHTAYPSIARLSEDTEMDRKTVMSAIRYLIEKGIIEAQRRAGARTTYRLVGVEGRESTSTKNGTGTKSGTSTKNGTAPVPNLVPQPVPNLGHEPINNQSGTNHKNTAREKFADFWKAYPAKKAKQDAAKAFAKLTDADIADVLADIPKRAALDRAWLGGYVPNPATYLRGRRWEDEITPVQQQPKGNHAAGYESAHDRRARINAMLGEAGRRAAEFEMD
jgi:hypothetical protein